jgi:aminoacyl tRNA synthase complex-interacting multifunctional protein 1
LTINAVDLRVGPILKVGKHSTAKKLYVEEVDVGEQSSRPTASGLVSYYSLDQLDNRLVIVVCNLKPRNLAGFKSHGMVLCATIHEVGINKVEFIDSPRDAKPGDRIIGEGLIGDPLTPNQIDKQKVFDIIAPDLKVNEIGVATSTLILSHIMCKYVNKYF